MNHINEVVSLTYRGPVAVITVNSPPVNALSVQVRNGIYEGLMTANKNTKVKAIILICEGRTFIAGADLKEINGKKSGVDLNDLCFAIENSHNPVITAMHGSALGGGLELALSAHFRVATSSAKLGFPEVNLGLVPGAGGTQRLPRVVGVQQALEMVASGKPISSQKALKIGLVDLVVSDAALLDNADDFAYGRIERKESFEKTRDNNLKLEEAQLKPEIFDTFRKKNARRFKRFPSLEDNIRCVEFAVNAATFEEGLKFEHDCFKRLLHSPESAAQRYFFFAERQVKNVTDIAKDTLTRPISKVGIIGAGTMGGGIAMNFTSIGIPVTIVEMQQEALDRGLSVIRKNYLRNIKSGRITKDRVEENMDLLTGSLEMQDLSDCDLIIEAVYENVDVKLDIFKKLDNICKQGAILATNTSAISVDIIAAATKRPEDVIGLHFFSPANVMKLLEVIRGKHTSKEVIATSMQLAVKIGKIAVLSRVCHGFIGNRMLQKRQQEAQKLLLDGAMPWDIDRVLTDFGFPMGPFSLSDLVGLDLGWRPETSKGETLREILCEADRRGQKVGAGYYDYDENRNKMRSSVTESIIKNFIVKSGGVPREVSDQEILERCIYPMLNEGVQLLGEGIAQRSSDIDVVWVNGFGWPVYRGGPMYYAEKIGLETILVKMKEFSAVKGSELVTSEILETLVENGTKLSDVGLYTLHSENNQR